MNDLEQIPESSVENELAGTELEEFEAAAIEDVEFIEDERAISIIESVLFATDKSISLNGLKQIFKGTSVKTQQIRQLIESLKVDYAGGRRGVSIEEVNGGYQLRTKIDNMNFLKTTVKARPFKLSGPALEVLAIVAYRQPCPKAIVDEVRGVESGHLLRALMEKDLVHFDGRSELPGKPMLYSTTRRFLEIFGLRNLRELPSLSEIDELMPEGIGDEPVRPTLSHMTELLSEQIDVSYSQGEDELLKISADLEQISTRSEFFEAERERQRQEKDHARAQDLRERIVMGESIEEKDLKWLEKYEAKLV